MFWYLPEIIIFKSQIVFQYVLNFPNILLSSIFHVNTSIYTQIIGVSGYQNLLTFIFNKTSHSRFLLVLNLNCKYQNDMTHLSSIISIFIKMTIRSRKAQIITIIHNNFSGKKFKPSSKWVCNATESACEGRPVSSPAIQFVTSCDVQFGRMRVGQLLVRVTFFA